jgi:hypothetical protein
MYVLRIFGVALVLNCLWAGNGSWVQAIQPIRCVTPPASIQLSDSAVVPDTARLPVSPHPQSRFRDLDTKTQEYPRPGKKYKVWNRKLLIILYFSGILAGAGLTGLFYVLGYSTTLLVAVGFLWMLGISLAVLLVFFFFGRNFDHQYTFLHEWWRKASNRKAAKQDKRSFFDQKSGKLREKNRAKRKLERTQERKRNRAARLQKRKSNSRQAAVRQYHRRNRQHARRNWARINRRLSRKPFFRGNSRRKRSRKRFHRPKR